jgi:hypothetical protein
MKPIRAWMEVDKDGGIPVGSLSGKPMLWLNTTKRQATREKNAGNRVIPVEIREVPKKGKR